MRIVSLLPSATEIVCALGLADQLVGVSADSDWPPEVVQRLPVLNTVSLDPGALSSAEIDAAASSDAHAGASLYHVDSDLLRSLEPDVILTQEICEVCAVSRRDLDLALATRMLGSTPRVLSLSPATLSQVLDDVALVAGVADVADRGASLRTELQSRIDSVRQAAQGVPRPRVFCMEWLDPPWTAGHWVPEMVELAGGCDGLGTPAGPSRRIDWDEVVAYAPEIIVLMPCSLELERVASEFAVVAARPGWSALPAVEARRVYAGNTHLFSRSGPRLVDGLETLGRVLHPEVFRGPLAMGAALKLTDDGRALAAYQ